MDRRPFLLFVAVAGVAVLAAQQEASSAPMAAIPVVASETVVYESPDAATIYAYSPGIALTPNGRIIATMDQGGLGVKDLPGVTVDADGRLWRGKIYTSDDKGKTWTHRADMPFMHARPFVAGDALYVIGHDRDLGVIRSDDWGETWTGPSWFSQGQKWHQAPCNVHYTHGRVYLVMERSMDPDFPHWDVSVMAPVLMSADVTADLTQRDAWTFSNELPFNKVIEEYGEANLFGVPFYEVGDIAPDSKTGERFMSPIGWLETNVVQIVDPNHIWYDPNGRTFHLLMRAHTGSTNIAALAKAVEGEDGSLSVGIERAPSGAPMIYLPMPGGQMKFHILYDEVDKLYWLLSTQATDSMIRPDRLPNNRFNLPNNERHRLVLHVSSNCVDWRFVARVADTGEFGQGRHYASMAISGDDLYVLSRSGDHRAKSAHDGNLITFHTIPGFRRLVY